MVGQFSTRMGVGGIEIPFQLATDCRLNGLQHRLSEYFTVCCVRIVPSLSPSHVSLSSLIRWQFSPWHTDRPLHYTPIHASCSQRLGAELPAPLHQEGTQLTSVNGLHYGFLLSLELERALPIRLNEKKGKNNCAKRFTTPHPTSTSPLPEVWNP